MTHIKQVSNIQLKQVTHIIDFTDLHHICDESNHVLYTSACIIPFLHLVVIGFVL